MISKSIIFKPPCFLSAIIVFFLILGVLLSQIKLKMILLILSISGFGIVKSEVLYTSLARPSVLTIFILPMRVSLRLFQLCRVCSRLDQFRYIKIQPKTIDLSTRLVGINTEFVGFIPKSLVLRSIVLA